MDAQKNQLYCATLCYAWNEIEQSIGPTYVDEGFPELHRLYANNAWESALLPEEIHTSVEVLGDQIRASASFDKALPFEFKFQRNKRDMAFGGTPVESFGIVGTRDDAEQQVRVLFYNSSEEFAVRLRPEDSSHEIVLYMPENKEPQTLWAMVDQLNQMREHHSQRHGWRYEYT